MSVSLRTVLRWLDEQRIQDQAECWVLSGDTVEPITYVTWTGGGDVLLLTRSVWAAPAPTPLQYRSVCDTLLEHYAGGGALKWTPQPEYVYRGSYVLHSDVAVFFIFLPDNVEIIESHEQKMENRKEQAIELTRKIEESQSWPTSM